MEGAGARGQPGRQEIRNDAGLSRPGADLPARRAPHAVESVQVETIDTTGALQQEQDLTIVSIGWVPIEGLSITASLEAEEITDISGLTFNFDTTVIAVGWSF